MMPPATSDRVAHATSYRPYAPPTSDSKISSADKSQVICDSCWKPRHMRETCWKIHGCPSRGQGGRSTSTHSHDKVQNGLHYMDPHLASTSSTVVRGAHTVWTNSSLSSLLQWHKCLGHPSFRVLFVLFPNLAKDCTKEQFVCEVCELAKHTLSLIIKFE
ncbi:gag_pre-integrs domain-containing protein [Cephalotus follicularis]|uniref:Gag_pre-integrs domain-containing protein n=1 Tax=Cephalotus follicularis TaxID=3775 RepID=A0A1Q3AUN7_CEPFO|nr:gag_pre-integrs domain-containing protein [Cephalotus follicularis]